MFKDGDGLHIFTYRPISVLFFFSKIIQKLLVLRLASYISKFNVISAEPVGVQGWIFHATYIIISNKFKESIDAGYLVGMLFIDRSKTFDSLNHHVLFKN